MAQQEIAFDFEPDAARARALDARMQRELGSSLKHVCEAAQSKLTYDEEGVLRLTEALATGASVSPAMFARYYELVAAIEAGHWKGAEQLFAEFASAGSVVPPFKVHALGDGALGGDSDRYQRMMNQGGEGELGFAVPEPDVAAAFRDRLEAGFLLLDRALPNLADEIRGIVREVIIIGSDDSKKFQADGGSHYQLWGALFLNGAYHPDELAVAEVLAHESAHSLLFGFCIDEPLVLNDDEALYGSPLRLDSRPMDGVYHATFVSARMHWAMSQLAAGEALTLQEKDRARAAAATDAENFFEGHTVVAKHGELTATGAALMSGAKSYMDRAALA